MFLFLYTDGQIQHKHSKLPVTMKLENFQLKFMIFLNKFVMHLYSSDMWYFSRLPLTMLPIVLPHRSAITLEASQICDPIKIYAS